MQLKTNFLKIFLYVALICIGIIIGIAIRHYGNLPLSESLNIIDLATLVTTIFLAVYVPEVLDRKLQVAKDKKHLIEQKIEELQALYRKVNLLVQSDLQVSSRSILLIDNTLDVSKSKIETIRNLLIHANLGNNFVEELDEIEKLCEKHKDLLWINEAETEKFAYSIAIQKREELLYNEIDSAISLLIFKISLS